MDDSSNPNHISREFKAIAEMLFEKVSQSCSGLPNATNDSNTTKQKVFMSYCYGTERAWTVNGIGNSLKTAYESARNLAAKSIIQKGILPKWIMIDIVTNETVIPLKEYYQMLNRTRRGYLRYGVAFDEMYNTAFLEQEIYGNSLIKYIKKDEQYFNIDNINGHIKKHRNHTSKLPADFFHNPDISDNSDNSDNHDKNMDKPIIIFETKGYFYDEGVYVPLESSVESLHKGIRHISLGNTPEEQSQNLLALTHKTADSLLSTLNNDGSFVYGYYPCFSKVASGYNVPRHSLAVYSLADLYLLSPKAKYKESALLALEYMLDNYVYYHDEETAFIIDHVNENETEIKLGALGMAILAITKCMEIFDENDSKEKYITILRKLGNGILYLQNKETGNYTHVLSYPSMELKEEFRIVYYAGEACFALTRLYTVDRNQKWMDAIELAFDFFIANDYHKFSDHWLAYAVNEISLYKTEDKYYEFGLKNAFYDLDFIINRDTTWNTFLEMLNVSIMVVNKIQEMGKSYLLRNYDIKKLEHALETRFNRQLSSIMFPEMAMFFKEPFTVLYGIFIRHQTFRVRNDDVAHHLMGYSNYYRLRFLSESQSVTKKWAFSSNELQEILGGYWYPDAPSFLSIDYLALFTKWMVSPNTCFVAMSNETWHEGSGGRGHYGNIFSDSHVTIAKHYFTLPKVKQNLVCIIAERPIAELFEHVPQLIVENSYEAMMRLAIVAREKMAENGKVIAITGAVGKSTTVNMLQCLLNDESDYISNTNGHNSRTGVPLWLASVGRFNPEFNQQGSKPNICTLEVAESALWATKSGICTIVRPHICVVTHVALTQWHVTTRNDRDVAVIVSRVFNGIMPDGFAVLYYDMPYFDLVEEKAVNCGASIITYGETDNCDSYIQQYSFNLPTAGDDNISYSTSVTAKVLGEKITYQMDTIGKPCVINSLAALTVAKLSGFNIANIAKNLSYFRPIANTGDVFGCGGVCIVDCSKNSEIPSIIAAFDILNQIKQKPGTRKIVLLSRIVNLTEHNPKCFLKLAKPIQDSGFDRFFLHEPTNEFRDLIYKIPSKMLGGKYKTVEEVVNAVIEYINEGDSILVMGAPRASDFGKVMDLLQNGILKKKEAGWPKQPPSASVLVFSADKNKIVWQKGDVDEKYPGGLGLPIMLYYLLDLIRKEKLSWHDKVTVNEYAAKESHFSNSLGLAHLEKLDLLTLFKAAVINNSPDAITALSGHIFEKIGESKNKTVPMLRSIGLDWGIPSSAIKNVSGRYFDNNPQYFTPEYLLKVGIQIMSFDYNNILFQKNMSHNEKYFEGILNKVPITNYLSYSTNSNTATNSTDLAINTICMCEYGDETLFVAISRAKTLLEHDILLLEALHRARTPLPEPSEEFVSLKKSAITLCGDTYCGERYTKWRVARGIEDPIQRYGDEGYLFSFEKVASLISHNTFNIVNSECVLSPVYDETQQTGKYLDFVLGGNPEKTIACYRKTNINAVMLANNHAMDFGATGCRQTRRYFEEAGIFPIGTGSNIDEAEKPLLLELCGKRIIIFSAYCYYIEKRNKIFRHYSLGANTGTAFGTTIVNDISLWCKIRQYRDKYEDAFIIFSPHWSTDFNKNHLHLRPIAARAFEAGADIILGHGPHIPVGAEHVSGKVCVYSLGNFVFNTTGIDLDASGHSPYGIVAQIHFSHEHPELRLYPIYVHNLKTFFQPYPVTDNGQFEEFTSGLIGLKKFSKGYDDVGHYLSMSL